MPVQGVGAEGAHLGAQHRLHRPPPGGRHPQLVRQMPGLVQALFFKPALPGPVLILEGRLLQGFQGRPPAQAGLQALFDAIQPPAIVGQGAAQVLDVLGGLIQTRLGIVPLLRQGLFPDLQLRQFFLEAGLGQLGQFRAQAFQAPGQLLFLLFLMGDTGPLHLGLLGGLGSPVIEILPFLLPGVHGVVRAIQLEHPFLLLGPRQFQARFLVRQAGRDPGQFFRILVPLTGGGGQRLVQLFDFPLLTAGAFPLKLEGLLHAGNVGTHPVIAALDLVKAVPGIVGLLPDLFQTGLVGTLIRHRRFQSHFQTGPGRFLALQLLIEGAPAQCQEFGLEAPFLDPKLLIALGGGRLAFQMQ